MDGPGCDFGLPQAEVSVAWGETFLRRPETASFSQHEAGLDFKLLRLRPLAHQGRNLGFRVEKSKSKNEQTPILLALSIEIEKSC